ncbi:lantibiotic dehydratase [Kitasatospora sp. NBC_01246]|uniref:lantibiotic dehydratase n=1 Tax=Kitasatospora sp. NBC_01246 TaxID=2903570 RepID=UPI002E307366|nr:lantibiotic dehydratase [Kitasatospora sp. NBC_01246]
MEWLRSVWELQDLAEGLHLASPALAAQMRTLVTATAPLARDVRRSALALARYLLRATSRATPFGLFAGVTSAGTGASAAARWGSDHRAVASASAHWLAGVIARLEACPELRGRLPVIANSALSVRGDRLIVPYQPSPDGQRSAAVEVSLRHTAPVSAALAMARTPVRLDDLTGKLLADFPAAGPQRVTALLDELIARRALITALHAPSTSTDALGHLVTQLEAAGARAIAPVADLTEELREIHTVLQDSAERPAEQTRPDRQGAAARMNDLLPTERHPLTVDLRLDATIALPPAVAREAERAALALARVSAAPWGTASWKAYHQRFYERFGIGSMVPVTDVVADSGIGFPDGYPGSTAGERRPTLTGRDEALVRLAQGAALDGRDEVVLDEAMIASLSLGPDRVRLPPHLELGVRVHAAGTADLEWGKFKLEVVSVSRGAGVGTGRFLQVLDPAHRAAFAAELADLPGADPNTVAAQLSFPPLEPDTAHVTRAPRILSTAITLEEHRPPGDGILTLQDLAVGCDGRRMYLAAPTLGRRVEAVAMHALNPHTHTPPLARFLAELSRAQCAAVTLFDWGAARTMPFLPRLRHGRTVLSPARWRLESADLPARARPWAEWDAAFAACRSRRRVPQQVSLTEGDRLLPLDLEEVGHRALLRAHLDAGAPAVLTEAARDAGWCEGRAHEIVVPLKAARPPQWPALPAPTRRRTTGREHGQTPAASTVLLAGLYGDIRRQDTLLAQHLPDLLQRLGEPPWWYVRFRDPDQHLRLRIALPDPAGFAPVAATVSSWADELHHAGLLREVRYPVSYPEWGRWGAGAAWDAAENVFRADSRALLAQLRRPAGPDRRALVAAHSIAIAAAFLGSAVAGADWIIENVPPAAPARVRRAQFAEAVRLADPRGDWAALRAVPGGGAIVEAWAGRDAALAAYRAHLPGPDTHGIAVDDVLGSLLHVHFVRAVAVDFPEEAICLYLARAAALAWKARTAGGNA